MKKVASFFRQILIIRHENKALKALRTADLHLNKAARLIQRTENVGHADMVEHRDICAVSLCIAHGAKVIKGIVGPRNWKEVKEFIETLAEKDRMSGRTDG